MCKTKKVWSENANRTSWHWIDARVLSLVDLTHSPRSIARTRSLALEIVKRALWIYSFSLTFFVPFLPKRKKKRTILAGGSFFFSSSLVFLTRNKFFLKYVVSAPANKQSCDQREKRKTEDRHRVNVSARISMALIWSREKELVWFFGADFGYAHKNVHIYHQSLDYRVCTYANCSKYVVIVDARMLAPTNSRIARAIEMQNKM